MKTKLKNQKGFTIIEVLIVLAIAGLILLIVFLAVPALQRNSRNTQRKNDVAALLAAVSEFQNNNNGISPNTVAWTNTSGVVAVKGPAGTTEAEAKVGYYNKGIGATNGYVNKLADAAVTGANTLETASTDYVNIATGTDCNGEASATGSARSITAVYQIENASNKYSQVCQSS